MPSETIAVSRSFASTTATSPIAAIAMIGEFVQRNVLRKDRCPRQFAIEEGRRDEDVANRAKVAVI